MLSDGDLAERLFFGETHVGSTAALVGGGVVQPLKGEDGGISITSMMEWENLS